MSNVDSFLPVQRGVQGYYLPKVRLAFNSSTCRVFLFRQASELGVFPKLDHRLLLLSVVVDAGDLTLDSPSPRASLTLLPFELEPFVDDLLSMPFLTLTSAPWRFRSLVRAVLACMPGKSFALYTSNSSLSIVARTGIVEPWVIGWIPSFMIVNRNVYRPVCRHERSGKRKKQPSLESRSR